MSRPHLLRPRRIGAVILALLAAVAATGCVYRLDIQQGNLLKLSDIDKVTVGMTRSQVRYLLGTPMVSDPFAPERWDYVYRMQYGRSQNVDSAHIVVRFDGDNVSSVDFLDMPKPPQQSRPKSWAFWKKPPAAVPVPPPEPAAPPISGPSPDANKPGGG